MSKFTRSILAIVAIATLAVALAACTADPKAEPNNAAEETDKLTQNYMEAALSEVPYPLEEMRASGWMERRNVRERMIRFADPNKISYIYLLTEQGQLIASYTIRGKVSHVASQLSTTDMFRKADCGQYDCDETVGAPMDDGTWGPSEDAIFFFTTDGVMVQHNGDYVLADAPLNITSTPILVYNENSEPTSVGDEGRYGGQ